MKRSIPLALLIISSFAGCAPIPHFLTYAPRVSGNVIDEKTHKPVVGAKVDYLYRDSHRVGMDFTDTRGSFRVGPLRQFHYLLYVGSPGIVPFPLGLSVEPGPNMIYVSANGYQPFAFRVSDSVTPVTGASIELSPKTSKAHSPVGRKR